MKAATEATSSTMGGGGSSGPFGGQMMIPGMKKPAELGK